MLHVIPSYGRDYKSAAALKADWTAGKDFTIADMSSPDDSRQVNRADYPSGKVQARYARLAKVCVFDAAAPPPAPKKARAPREASPAKQLQESRDRARLGDIPGASEAYYKLFGR